MTVSYYIQVGAKAIWP